VTGVVGIVAATPCCSMDGMARVTSEVHPPCVRSMVPTMRFGRGDDCARAQGGRARQNLSPSPRGSVRRRPCPSPGGSGETELAPELGKFERFPYSFLRFLSL